MTVLRFPPRGPTAQLCFLCGGARTHVGVCLQVVLEAVRGEPEEVYATEARLCSGCASKAEIGPLVLFEAAHELATMFAADSVAAYVDDDDEPEPH